MNLAYVSTQIFYAFSAAWTAPFVAQDFLSGHVRLEGDRLFVSGLFCDALKDGADVESMGTTEDRHGLGKVEYFLVNVSRRDCPLFMPNSLRVYRPMPHQNVLVLDFGYRRFLVPQYVRLRFE